MTQETLGMNSKQRITGNERRTFLKGAGDLASVVAAERRVRAHCDSCHRKEGGVNKKQSDLRIRSCLASSPHNDFSSLIFEAAHTALEFVFGIGPKPLDHPGIVVAVREVMVQSRETMTLAG
jgi:hypothetical protein